MNGTLEMVKKGKHDKQVRFAAYKQCCDDIAVEKKRAIHDPNEEIYVSYEDLGSDGAVTVVTVVPGLPKFPLA